MSSTIYPFAKRLLDLIGAMIGLVTATPIIAAAAVAIRLDSPGPIFYAPYLPGRHGKLFRCYKLRTMRVDAEEWLRQHPGLWEDFNENFKLRWDPRVTRVGRFLRRYSIDELPQFWNILRGEMSLVGPRPKLPSEPERYGEAWPIVASVPPGLTGYWQVMGRQTVDYATRIKLDVYYVTHRSFWLDLWILAKTPFAVLSGRGAF